MKKHICSRGCGICAAHETRIATLRECAVECEKRARFTPSNQYEYGFIGGLEDATAKLRAKASELEKEVEVMSIDGRCPQCGHQETTGGCINPACNESPVSEQLSRSMARRYEVQGDMVLLPKATVEQYERMASVFTSILFSEAGACGDDLENFYIDMIVNDECNTQTFTGATMMEAVEKAHAFAQKMKTRGK